MSDHLGEILAVDDTPNNLKLLQMVLEQAGYKVRLATSGPMALTSVQAKSPDLILLDMNMPEMDGKEVCRRLKADPATKDIPIMFLTVAQETGEKVQAFEVGAVDYLTKPFSPPEMLARVNTHLRLRNLQRELQEFNRQLEQKVQERTKALANIYIASLTISSQVVVKELLHALLTTIIQATEFERVIMLSLDGDAWKVAAFTGKEAGDIHMASDSQPSVGDYVPLAIIERVKDTRELYVGDCPPPPSLLLSDPYFQAHAPSAFLCVPLQRKDALMGLLYMERYSGSMPLQSDLLTIVEILSAQAAVSIENAQLYEHLQQSLREQELLVREKDILLAEVNHRVKNNLQVISSLLKLQANQIEDPQTQQLFQENQSRVHAMAMAHDQLVNEERVVEQNLPKYFESITRNLQNIYARPGLLVTIQCQVEPLILSLSQLINCGLIVTELVSNAFKHAFADRAEGTIMIGMCAEGDAIRLWVQDDGLGIPSTVDVEQPKSLGLELIRSLSEHQLGGSLHFQNGKGTGVEIRFPKNG